MATRKMSKSNRLLILDHSCVSPPAGSVPPTNLPLISFFDILWFNLPPSQVLFFYHHPHSTSHFTKTTLPVIKHSLSLTLQHFFPLAGTIFCPPLPHKPGIRYVEGDSVSLTVIESNEDFNHFISNHSLINLKLLQPFVPQLPPSRVSPDGTHVFPIMALQVTVFPNVGICVGMSHHHMAADGISIMHFMRSWASFCKSKGDVTCLDPLSLPSHNREVITDPYGCDSDFLKLYWSWVQSRTKNHDDQKPNNLQSSFTITQVYIEKLKQWVKSECINNGSVLEHIRISSFVVTCAFMWICMIQSDKVASIKGDNDVDDMYCLTFAMDCRDRVTEFPLPSTYFGNCIAPGLVLVKKSELLRKNGIFTAVKAIGREVKEMMEGSALKGVGLWMLKFREMVGCGHIVSVSGSPKMRIYEIDFGWGRPENVEFTHVSDRLFGISECKNGREGIDVMLGMSMEQMDAFTTSFNRNLKLFQ